jgi:Ca2+-binding RTX toxin-like protein
MPEQANPLLEVFGTSQDDTIDVRAAPRGVIVKADYGDDLVFGSRFGDRLHAGPGFDWLYGNDGNDELFGSAGWDRLNGGDGMDVIWATGNRGASNNRAADRDMVVSGDGRDIIYGGDEGRILVKDFDIREDHFVFLGGLDMGKRGVKVKDVDLHQDGDTFTIEKAILKHGDATIVLEMDFGPSFHGEPHHLDLHGTYLSQVAWGGPWLV